MSAEEKSKLKSLSSPGRCIDHSYDRGLPSVTRIMLQSPVRFSFWKSCLLILLALCTLRTAVSQPPSGMPRAQRHESRHEIDQMEDAWRNAIMSRNAAAMEALLADDYLAITANGTLQSKDEALANLRGGLVHIASMDFSDRKVRFYGQTALVTSRAEVNGTAGENNISGSYRYTRVYVRGARGEWKIVSFEASRIREQLDRR